MSTTLPTRFETAFEPPHWLQNHVTGHPVAATKTQVQDALVSARRSLEVAGPRVAAALLAKYLAGYPMPENFQRDLAPLYLETLEDLPADLLQEGLKTMRRNHSFNSLPKEADIRKWVEQDLADRRATVLRLEGILERGRFAEEPRRKRTPEETAEGLKMFAKIREILAETGEGMKP